MLAKGSSGFWSGSPGDCHQRIQVLPAARISQHQLSELDLIESGCHIGLSQGLRRAQRHHQHLGFGRIGHHFEIESAKFALKKQTPQATGQHRAQGVGKGFELLLLNPRPALQR